jgi:uroporphyrin-III C-methyltransferase
MAATVLALAAMAMAWSTRERSQSLEQTLVQRQTQAQNDVSEARALARAADVAAREAQSKSAMLEARVAESTVQRSQMESLMLQLSKTRDDNVVTELEALVRAATLQASWTGRAEPLVAALKQVDDRLGASPSPRLTPLKRAIGRDLQRLTASASTDTTALALRVDDLLKRADELPLLVPLDGDPVASSHAASSPAASSPAPVAGPAQRPAQRRPTVPLDTPARSQPDALPGDAPWFDRVAHAWRYWWRGVTEDMRALVRVRRVDQPTAQMLSPEQAYFVRENLKLRLLSARWALLSRQFTLAQTDLSQAQALINANHDKQSKRVEAALDTLQQLMVAAQQPSVATADETLNLLTTLGNSLAGGAAGAPIQSTPGKR